MEGMYNMRSPAVKRLMKEAQELREPTEQYEVHPLEDNLFEWHFTIRGPADSEFEGGIYHGRIILPPEYPMKPPSILMLTHNGRFEVNRKICLSISGHHPESWQPSWSIRTALLAIIGFMPTHGAGALGSLDYPEDERKKLAKRSVEFKCPSCGSIGNILKPVTEESKKTTQEARELAAQIDFKDEKEKNAAMKSMSSPSAETVGVSATQESTTEGATSSQQTQSSQQTIFSQQYLQQQQQSFTPPPFGQFPFRMPFLPPFPMNPSQQQTTQQITTTTGSLAHVPRFPLPYMAPMMPPFHPMMNAGNFPMMPPMMPPGMAVPPWGARMPVPPFSPPATATEESSDSNTRDTTTPTNTVNPATISSDNNNLNTENELSQNLANTDNTGETSEPADIPTPTETPAVNPDSTTTTSTTTTTTSQASTESDGLRRRTVVRETPSTNPAPHRHVFQTAEIPQATRQSESPAFLIFAAVIIIIIALLLVRRISSMKYLSLLF